MLLIGFATVPSYLVAVEIRRQMLQTAEDIDEAKVLTGGFPPVKPLGFDRQNPWWVFSHKNTEVMGYNLPPDISPGGSLTPHEKSMGRMVDKTTNKPDT